MFNDILAKFKSGSTLNNSGKKDAGYVKNDNCGCNQQPPALPGLSLSLPSLGLKMGKGNCGGGNSANYGSGMGSSGYTGSVFYTDNRRKVNVGGITGVNRPSNSNSSGSSKSDRIENVLEELTAVRDKIKEWAKDDVKAATGLDPDIVLIPGLSDSNLKDVTLSGKTGSEVADDLYNRGIIDEDGRDKIKDSGMSGGQIEQVITGSISKDTASNIKDSNLWYELDDANKTIIDRVITTVVTENVKISIINIITVIIINRGYDFIYKNFVVNIDLSKFPDLGLLDEYYKKLDSIRDEIYKNKDILTSLQDIIKDLNDLKNKVVNDGKTLEDLLNNVKDMLDKSKNDQSSGNNGSGNSGNGGADDYYFGSQQDPSKGSTASDKVQDLISGGGGISDAPKIDWTGSSGSSDSNSGSGGNGNSDAPKIDWTGSSGSSGGNSGSGGNGNSSNTGTTGGSSTVLPGQIETPSSDNTSGVIVEKKPGSDIGWWDDNGNAGQNTSGGSGSSDSNSSQLPSITDDNLRDNNNNNKGWENADNRTDAVINTITREIETSNKNLNESELDDIISNAEAGFDIIGGNNDGSSKNLICPESGFILEHYININDRFASPIITEGKIKNLEKIYYSILRPIVIHYLDSVDDSQCILRIVNGLCSQAYAVSMLTGHALSRHIYGEAVDFFINGVSSRKIFEDIRSGVIEVDYGVLSLNPGHIHVTLPYTFKGSQIYKLNIQGDATGNNVFDLVYDW